MTYFVGFFAASLSSWSFSERYLFDPSGTEVGRESCAVADSCEMRVRLDSDSLVSTERCCN